MYFTFLPVIYTECIYLIFATYKLSIGKDFQAIAEMISTKTEAHMKTFWASYRRRYNLDAVLREYEAERGGGPSSSVALPSSPSADNSVNPDAKNGNFAIFFNIAPLAFGLLYSTFLLGVNGEETNEVGGSSTGAAGGAIGRSNSPIVIKDDKVYMNI